jgi:hypothetical protein
VWFFFFATAPDQVHKQAVLCHRILRTLQAVARESTIMTAELWEELLLLLLSINDTLLAPPYEKGLSIHRYTSFKLLSVINQQISSDARKKTGFSDLAICSFYNKSFVSKLFRLSFV